jgi:hypothetical protein
LALMEFFALSPFPRGAYNAHGKPKGIHQKSCRGLELTARDPLAGAKGFPQRLENSGGGNHWILEAYENRRRCRGGGFCSFAGRWVKAGGLPAEGWRRKEEGTVECPRIAPKRTLVAGPLRSGLVYRPLFMGADKASRDALQKPGRNRGDCCILFKAAGPKRKSWLT